jgi:alkylation response protein AidB-like acyl-CoA dehydrogenase
MENPGQADLLQWRAAKPTNFYTAVPSLEATMASRMDSKFTDDLKKKLEDFGRVVATEIEPAVQLIEQNREFPKLHSYDEIGQHVERIEFHPASTDAARAAWASGMLATPLTYEGAYELAAQFFLLSHVGEGGQACPIVCTVGLRRALELRASDVLKHKYVNGLKEIDSSLALRGSQFLTEIQGGSDVGAITTMASPDGEIPGAWRVTGEKWFCSVADADLFAVVARSLDAPAGTKGLGCFLIPRTLDGVTPNGFRIRRLKDKLGTRGLASGEIDFEDALAFPIGNVDEGFSVAVSELLNTSRWLNAVGSTGIMSRAYLEASSFAHHRRAFGTTIENFESVREQLAVMKIEVEAALASTLLLTELVGKLDEGIASDEETKFHRFLVNANKYVTSITATEIVHSAIEVLGGNGTIEDFSPLPRLYRDSIVFESWEGTHNVLCAQVHRDCARLGLLDTTFAWIDTSLSAVSLVRASDVEIVRAAVARLEGRIRKSVQSPTGTPAEFRPQLARLTRIIQAVCLFENNDERVSTAFVQRHLSSDAYVTSPPIHQYFAEPLD